MLGSVPLGAQGSWPRLMSQGAGLVRSSPRPWLGSQPPPPAQATSLLTATPLKPPLQLGGLPQTRYCVGPSPGESQPSEGEAEHGVGLSKIQAGMQACHHGHWWDRLHTQVFSTKLCFCCRHTGHLRLPCPRLASAPSSPIGRPQAGLLICEKVKLRSVGQVPIVKSPPLL